MPSIFGEGQLHTNSFRADDLELDIAGDAKGALVQQVNFTLTRTVNMLYEIGSTNVYYVGNRRQGQAQLQRIVGGSGSFQTLLTEYGNMCEPKPLALNATSGCGGGAVNYNMLAATLTQVGASVTAQEIVITESLGFIFADLEIT